METEPESFSNILEFDLLQLRELDVIEVNEDNHQEGFTDPYEETGQMVKNRYLRRGPDGTYLDMHVIKFRRDEFHRRILEVQAEFLVRI
ncbi:hypothetical protein E2C01_060385 [Portunus trituberculatus]|uniref:Uncharacterized protein n=1 Tax=Portunus trituberculatus TaxID=210409 RepID=A0A5B7HAB8_PORTR|nr:hypothetical protein [Portunus trituberculatus]